MNELVKRIYKNRLDFIYTGLTKTVSDNPAPEFEDRDQTTGGPSAGIGLFGASGARRHEGWSPEGRDAWSRVTRFTTT